MNLDFLLTFFKVEENVLLVQFQFILPNAHPNRFVFLKHESNNKILPLTQEKCELVKAIKELILKL